jgi:hypothetical protein
MRGLWRQAVVVQFRLLSKHKKIKKTRNAKTTSVLREIRNPHLMKYRAWMRWVICRTAGQVKKADSPATWPHPDSSEAVTKGWNNISNVWSRKVEITNIKVHKLRHYRPCQWANGYIIWILPSRLKTKVTLTKPKPFAKHTSIPAFILTLASCF